MSDLLKNPTREDIEAGRIQDAVLAEQKRCFDIMDGLVQMARNNHRPTWNHLRRARWAIDHPEEEDYGSQSDES